MKGKLPPHAAYDSSVADRVARLNVVLKRQLGKYAKQNFDLTIAETRLLLISAIYGPSTINQLADQTDLDRTQISRSISALASRKLVRKSTGPVDRREAVIELTSKGENVHQQILAEMYARNQSLIEGLPKETLASFFDLMEVLIDRARNQASSSNGR